MAKKTKTEFQIRRVRNKEDRKRPSVFMRLKTDEAFKAYALFEPDPEADDNPGYYEYYDHYDNGANQYVPCIGENCPFCAANDNPSTRAITAWYFPEAGDVKDKIKLFTMNYGTTVDATDESEDEDGILGKLVRIKRLSDKGDYKVKISSGKALTKAQMKEAMKLLEEKLGEGGLEGIVMKQARAQMERLKALDAMEDDDDEDEDEDEPKKTKARKGKAEEAEEEDEDEDEDEDEEVEPIDSEEVEILKVSKKNNSITVSYGDEEIVLVGDEDEISVDGHKKGETVTVSAEWDEDDEVWNLTELSAEGDEDDDEEEEEAEAGEAEAEEIDGVSFTVQKVQEKDEILELKDEDDDDFKMWVGDGVDVDYDVVKKGATVTVSAEKDDEGDWIITALKSKKGPKAGKGGKKTKSKK